MKTTVIIAENPAKTAGSKGVRNYTTLKTIFPNPFTVGTIAGGTFPEDLKTGLAGEPVATSFSTDNDYKEWYFNNVVNGVVNDGGYYTIAGSSNFSMNYKNAPDLYSNEPPKDKDKNVVATNYFVPIVATLNIETLKLDDPLANDVFKSEIEKKSSKPPGSGGTAIGFRDTDRNPASTSANRSSPKMILEKFLPAVPAKVD